MATKEQEQQQKAPGAGGAREPIPVHEIKCKVGQKMFIPGHQSETHYAKTQTSGERSWVVEYMPWARFYRVTYTEGGKPPRYVHIPESWCQWEPATEGAP